MGFVGTWVGQALIASIGLLHTGVCALLLQAGSLALAAVIYRYSHVMTTRPCTTVSIRPSKLAHACQQASEQVSD